MATVVFTESAKQLAPRLLAAMPEYDKPCIPMVAVLWSNGVRDNHRGPDGKVVWEIKEPPGWKVVVAPWVESEYAHLPPLISESEGFPVLVDPRASSATGTLVVSAIDGKLSVSHQVT